MRIQRRITIDAHTVDAPLFLAHQFGSSFEGLSGLRFAHCVAYVPEFDSVGWKGGKRMRTRLASLVPVAALPWAKAQFDFPTANNGSRARRAGPRAGRGAVATDPGDGAVVPAPDPTQPVGRNQHRHGDGGNIVAPTAAGPPRAVIQPA